MGEKVKKVCANESCCLPGREFVPKIGGLWKNQKYCSYKCRRCQASRVYSRKYPAKVKALRTKWARNHTDKVKENHRKQSRKLYWRHRDKISQQRKASRIANLQQHLIKAREHSRKYRFRRALVKTLHILQELLNGQSRTDERG